MNFALRYGSHVHFSLIVMMFFHRFRRFALLCLSLTLSTQAMAVASFGACHTVKAVLSATQLAAYTHLEHEARLNAPAASVHNHGSDAHQDGAASESQSSDSSTSEKGRVKCPACAGCHLFNVVLPAESAVADIPKAESAAFAEFIVPRVRNVASGLERPPRA